MKNTLLTLFFALTLFSCGVDPCDYDCSEGPIKMRLVILDKKSGENLFETGFFARKELKITSNGEPVDFTWHEVRNQIILNSFEKTDSFSFLFQIQNIDFDLNFSVVEIEEKCCSNYHFENENVSDGEIEKTESGIYHIKIETE